MPDAEMLDRLRSLSDREMVREYDGLEIEPTNQRCWATLAEIER